MVTLNRQKDVDGQRIHKKTSKEEHSVHGVGVGEGLQNLSGCRSPQVYRAFPLLREEGARVFSMQWSYNANMWKAAHLYTYVWGLQLVP